MTRLSGGASQETWSMDVAAHDHLLPLILRRAPGGIPRAGSGNSVPLETEAIVIEAARMQGVAAPRVRYVLKPEDKAGVGYIMDRLPGETIARKILRTPRSIPSVPISLISAVKSSRASIRSIQRRCAKCWPSSTDRRSSATIARSTISTTIPIPCSSWRSSGSSRA